VCPGRADASEQSARARTAATSTPRRPTTWALDFQADQTSNGRPIRLVNIIDEHTREALVMHAARSIDADEVVARLDALWPGADARRGSCAWTTGPS
jgi:hypothetical protein